MATMKLPHTFEAPGFDPPPIPGPNDPRVDRAGTRGNAGVVVVIVLALLCVCCVKVCGRHPHPHRFRIYVVNACKSKAELGVRFHWPGDGWQSRQWWTIRAHWEGYLTFHGARVRTDKNIAHFHVKGNDKGTLGYVYGGKRYWMLPSEMLDGDILLRLPCDRKNGDSKHSGRSRPRL